MPKKPIIILGATGSIGLNALDIVRQFPDRFEVVGLSCNSQVEALSALVNEFQPRLVCVGDPAQRDWLSSQHPELQILVGSDGLIRLVEASGVELVLTGIVGAAGLKPGYAALTSGKDLAMANKEIMVLAGELMMQAAREKKRAILPVDSEHNAIQQSLMGHKPADVERIILTASGGPFRDLPLEQFPNITRAQALKHPNWEMGQKITIDSATMMNKGLEVIEARWLFDLPVERIEVVIHRQSIVHSLVEYFDGSFIAQLGLPDMRVPIAFCMGWPERLPLNIPKMKLSEVGRLDFQAVCFERFPCLKLAIEAAGLGGGAPAVLNGANEVAVAAFLKNRIQFVQIAQLLTQVMLEYRSDNDQPERFHQIETIADAIAADQWGRQRAEKIIAESL